MHYTINNIRWLGWHKQC